MRTREYDCTRCGKTRSVNNPDGKCDDCIEFRDFILNDVNEKEGEQ